MAGENTSLLDAPTDTNAGAAGKTQPESLIDTKPATNVDGKDGKTAPTSPDKTPPADSPTKGAQPDASKPAEKPAVVVPEKYADYKLPDGMTLNKDAMIEFDAKSKALNLSQEDRDTLLAIQVKHASAYAQEMTDIYKKTIADWTTETKEMLGADTDRALSSASKAIDSVLTDPKENKEFRELLAANGSGNHRLMVKVMSYFGKAISEDTFVEGKPGTKESKSLAERIYEPATK